jgi:undecaprenyl-diphosphatase
LTYIQSAILGIVQGVAEFLPISSSGHLTLFQHFFGMQEPDQLYNILLHFATLVAVCLYYWQDIRDMILEFFRGAAALVSREGGQEPPPPARRLVLLVIVGTLPLFLVLPIQDQVEALGSNPIFVSCVLLVTGVILFAADRMAKGHKTAKNATILDALLVGAAQAVATLPGLSRSGSTIAAGMALGFDRKFAVRYSFLLSLPAVLGATLIKVLHAVGDGIDTALLPKYLVGMVLSGVVGYFSIKLVNLLSDKGKFGAFAYYCWAAGGLSLVLCLLGVGG